METSRVDSKTGREPMSLIRDQGRALVQFRGAFQHTGVKKCLNKRFDYFDPLATESLVTFNLLACIYIYICIYIHTILHIYIYTYIIYKSTITERLTLFGPGNSATAVGFANTSNRPQNESFRPTKKDLEDSA